MRVLLLQVVVSTIIVVYIANVTAQDNTTVPVSTPSTLEPTTTEYPTDAPTRAPIPAPVPKRSCYTNLTEIEDLVKLKNPFILEKYILCPNTIYPIATPDADVNTTEIGFRTIFTRSNSIYQCGEDGKSSNNCILRGGDFHLLHDYFTYGFETKVNVVIKGLTFENAQQGAMILAAPGDISFIDCIFRNHNNLGVMPLVYTPIQNRKLMTYFQNILHDPIAYKRFKEDDARSHPRRVQSGEVLDIPQIVIVEGCIFENNGQGPTTPLTINGVISLVSADNELVISNSIFRNNTYTEPTDGRNGFAISSVEGAKLNITNVCFIDNEFTGGGAVVVQGTTDDFVSTDVFGTVDPELTCPFANIGADTCVEYDSTTCTALNGDNASAPIVPTTAPITSPVATTSNGVNIRQRISLFFFLSLLAVTLVE